MQLVSHVGTPIKTIPKPEETGGHLGCARDLDWINWGAAGYVFIRFDQGIYRFYLQMPWIFSFTCKRCTPVSAVGRIRMAASFSNRLGTVQTRCCHVSIVAKWKQLYRHLFLPSRRTRRTVLAWEDLFWLLCDFTLRGKSNEVKQTSRPNMTSLALPMSLPALQ